MKKLIAIILVLEALTLTYLFTAPALEHRVFENPRFPNIIVYHHNPPGCIVDFVGNIYVTTLITGLFWTIVVLGVAALCKLLIEIEVCLFKVTAEWHARSRKSNRGKF